MTQVSEPIQLAVNKHLQELRAVAAIREVYDGWIDYKDAHPDAVATLSSVNGRHQKQMRRGQEPANDTAPPEWEALASHIDVQAVAMMIKLEKLTDASQHMAAAMVKLDEAAKRGENAATIHRLSGVYDRKQNDLRDVMLRITGGTDVTHIYSAIVMLQEKLAEELGLEIENINPTPSSLADKASDHQPPTRFGVILNNRAPSCPSR